MKLREYGISYDYDLNWTYEKDKAVAFMREIQDRGVSSRVYVIEIYAFGDWEGDIDYDIDGNFYLYQGGSRNNNICLGSDAQEALDTATQITRVYMEPEG